jgi:AhpD family alkylhydroperoxidase
MSAKSQLLKQYEQEVEQRVGSMPAIFRANPDNVSAVAPFWNMARAAWLDNPLPPVFRERLLVYLALLVGCRYCLLRHATWLRTAGRLLDASQVINLPALIQLLQAPPPTDDELQRAQETLEGWTRADLPPPGSPHEQAVLVIAGGLCLGRGDLGQLRRVLVQALAASRADQIVLLITYFQAERKFAQLHPDLPVDEDAGALLKREPELAQLLEAAITSAEQRDRQRARFVSLLGHELRNPVAAISAVSDMFQVVGMEDERLRNASNILHRQTRSLTEMLDNLVEVAGLAFGRATLAKVPLVPDELLTGLLRQQESRFAERKVSVSHTPLERRVYVVADRARLTQVFEQILSNARKFASSPGNVQITSQIEGRNLLIRFHDDGRGFSADKSRTMFEAFTQSRQDSGGGLGLGLTIARMIVALHDGTLEADSPGPGQGAAFTLRLPLASQEMAPKPEKKNIARSANRMRVLAIEDNRDFAQLFRHMLEIMGCELDITSDARSGLKLAHERRPELIFCDIGLPGDMNGFDFARAVRADAQLARIPLVAVSGYSSPEDREKAMAAGFDRVCAKPVKFADISEALAAYSTKGPQA